MPRHTAIDAHLLANLQNLLEHKVSRGFLLALWRGRANSKLRQYVAIDTHKANGYKAAAPVLDPQVRAIVANAKAEIGPIFQE